MRSRVLHLSLAIIPALSMATILPITLADAATGSTYTHHSTVVQQSSRPNHGTASSPPRYGWSYVDLTKSFGTGTTISGITVTQQGLMVTVTQTFLPQKTYVSAAYNAQTHHLEVSHTALSPAVYRGSYQLNWNNRYNQTHIEGLQHVSIVHSGKQVVAWPKSVPVYGDPSQIQASGAVDNQIIGQSGDWLWIALKGPAKPPVPLSVSYPFRDWDRLLAVNVTSGSYRVYNLPTLMSDVDSSSTTPAFAVDNGAVYVGLSDWIGVLPTDPTAPSSPVDAALPWIHPTPSAARQAAWILAETELSAIIRQQAGSIAYLWDHDVMGKNVSGVSGTSTSWLSDGAYINHGAVPYALIFGAEFPLAKASRDEVIRNKLLSQLTIIGRNPLPSTVYALDTPQKQRQHFHGRPPAPLPGYRIQSGLYVPAPSTWPLPSSYRTYSDVFQSIGPKLAQSSPYSVWIPSPNAVGSLSPCWANVLFSVTTQAYNLQLYAGPKLPANSKSIVTGDANLIFTLHAQAASRPLGIEYQWDRTPTPQRAVSRHVSLGHGVIGTVYTCGRSKQAGAQKRIVWNEDGWTWSLVVPMGYPDNSPLTQAKTEVTELMGLHLPTPSGQGVFSLGSDAPSQVEFTWMNSRYVLYCNGWRAPQMAASMVDLSVY